MTNIEIEDDKKRGRLLDNEHWSDVLVQAMPYFKQWCGKVVVVKYGGNAMLNDELKLAVMKDLVLLHTIGSCMPSAESYWLDGTKAIMGSSSASSSAAMYQPYTIRRRSFISLLPV